MFGLNAVFLYTMHCVSISCTGSAALLGGTSAGRTMDWEDTNHGDSASSTISSDSI